MGRPSVFRALKNGCQLFRPQLEILERRLPPGDALWSLLIGCSMDGAAQADEPGHVSEIDIALIRTIAPELSVSSTPASTHTTVPSSTPTYQPEANVNDEFIDSSPNRQSYTRKSEMAPIRGSTATNLGASMMGMPITSHWAVTRTASFSSEANPQAVALIPEAEVADAADPEKVENAYANLPLSFEANHGQTDARVDFIARGNGYTLFTTPTEAVFSVQNSEFRIQKSEFTESASPLWRGLPTTPRDRPQVSDSAVPDVALHMQIVGGNPGAKASGLDQLPGKVNYFIGNNPDEWHANIPTFGRIEYHDVYPGIDLAYYGKDQQLEYDFIVSPGASPSVIGLSFAGADGIEINPHGDLVLHTAAGDLVQQKPYLYQDIDGARREVTGEFRIQNPEFRMSASGSGSSYAPLITFEVGPYDTNRPLVIDPVVSYSTYIDGSINDYGNAIGADDAGNAYIAGETNSPDFPVTAGAYDASLDYHDTFVAKLNPSGSALVYSTYLGGTGWDSALGVAVHPVTGEAAVTGYTTSTTSFPVTTDAFQTTFGGGSQDAFATRLSADGASLSYSTYLGGSGDWGDIGYAIATDAKGLLYVTGSTYSTDFPVTPGAYQTTNKGGAYSSEVFIVKLGGSTVADSPFSTYLGGTGHDGARTIAVSRTGSIYVGGSPSDDFPTTPGSYEPVKGVVEAGISGFVTKLSADGSYLQYSTFFTKGLIRSLSVGRTGDVYLTGETYSCAFPTTPGAYDTTCNGSFDAYVTRMNASGSALVYSTYLGGSGVDEGHGIVTNRFGNAFVVVKAGSLALPVTADAHQSAWVGGSDAYVVKLAADGSALNYASYLGGGAYEYPHGIALDRSGNFYVTGHTTSLNFPTTPGAFDTTYGGGEPDGFVTKFS